MDEPRNERYTTTDVMRATEPVVAPITSPEPVTNDDVRRAERATAPRVLDEPAAGAPGYERTTRIDRVDDRPGFSFGSSFLGWNVAAFWMLVLTGIALAILGTSAYNASNAGTTTPAIPLMQNLAIGGIVAFLVAQFLAYLIGGYAAGRMARGNGVANGLGVAVWGVVIAILLGVLGYAMGTQYNLGYWATFYGVNFANWTGQVVLGLALTLIAMFLGAILGGMLGARRYDRAYEERTETRGAYRRGRPL
jgi:hypothetical protein